MTETTSDVRTFWRFGWDGKVSIPCTTKHAAEAWVVGWCFRRPEPVVLTRTRLEVLASAAVWLAFACLVAWCVS